MNFSLNISKFFYSTFFILLLPVNKVLAQDTRLMSQPALSDTHIAFIYAEDLWVANKDGSNPKRLTIDEGIESNPIFSPDGKTIAFNAQYDGNTDVYVIPTTGGIPKRLTWHPYTDLVRDFTPDGKNVLFISQRSSYTNRYFQGYTVSVNGGTINSLKIPNLFWASYSPDGNYIAYTTIYDVFNQWKHYRGGTISTIYIYNTKTHKVDVVPKPVGGSNDSKPQWMGNDVYFRSDRDGEFNLYTYNVASKQVSGLTNYTDFPILDLNAHNDNIIIEQAGYLHIYNTISGTTNQLKIHISTDLLELRQRYVSGANYIRSSGISPSGARAVIDFRGDIVTVPAKKGDPNNITNTPGVHEKFPEWSPDGSRIAYFSDESGEYAIHIKNLQSQSVQKTVLNGSGFYAFIHWSPDSKKLAFVDNSRSLYVFDIVTKTITKIASDELYYPGVFRELFGSWSSDSSNISYTIVTETNFEQAFIYNLETKTSKPVSDGLANVTNPVFDPSGKYLYLLASTDAGPVVNWFDQSNIDMELTNNIYLVTLQKDVPSPFAKENDLEEPKKDDTKTKEEEEVKKEEVKKLIIDWEGITHRIVDVPLPKGLYSDLKLANEGELYYLKNDQHENTSMLYKYDLKTKKEETIMPVDGFSISADKEKMLFMKKGQLGIVETGKKAEDDMLNISAIQVKIDPKAEWENIFDEAWRVNRDYFYDPGMHGVDWPAMKNKYKAFLPDLSCKSDLYKVMGWMFSELGVGHHRFGYRGDDLNNPKSIEGGLLGADYVQKNNRYQISKIYGGLNWNPEMRSPLTEPGININIGDYIISVNGKNVTADDNLYSFFENTADKITTLKVSTNADGSHARTLYVTPIDNEWDLRRRDWVESNINKVNEATNGQVAYVYVPNTSTAGHEYFKRYFFPQATKKAIIVDERFNGGGSLADYYIDLLLKPHQANWNFRYGKDLKSPSASIQGPKVLITDETAGSGGDYFPWMFRKFKVGTIVGKRTWGGLVGVLGYPEFIDGGSVTAPNVAFYTEEGFKVENEGVAPDVEVEQWPELVIGGHDPQLEKAIEIVLKQLKENPPKEVIRPAYPIKSKQ